MSFRRPDVAGLVDGSVFNIADVIDLGLPSMQAFSQLDQVLSRRISIVGAPPFDARSLILYHFAFSLAAPPSSGYISNFGVDLPW